MPLSRRSVADRQGGKPFGRLLADARHTARTNKNGNGATLGFEAKLWQAADELRANFKLKASEYSIPVLGLIFLRHAEARFSQAEKELEGRATVSSTSPTTLTEITDL